LQELREFHQTQGHCRVPQRYPQNPSLGQWVASMRTDFKKRENGKKSSLTAERLAALNNLGFDWAVDSHSDWEIRLKELREFHKTYGHCRVLSRYLHNPSLGHWVSTMRMEFRKRENGKKSSLTAERLAALNSLGFDWVLVKQTAWEIRLQELREFHQTYGHCRVPQKYSQNPSLGKWVSRMRAEFKKGENSSSLTAERIATLNDLEFEWVVGTGNGSATDTTYVL